MTIQPADISSVRRTSSHGDLVEATVAPVNTLNFNSYLGPVGHGVVKLGGSGQIRVDSTRPGSCSPRPSSYRLTRPQFTYHSGFVAMPGANGPVSGWGGGPVISTAGLWHRPGRPTPARRSADARPWEPRPPGSLTSFAYSENSESRFGALAPALDSEILNSLLAPPKIDFLGH